MLCTDSEPMVTPAVAASSISASVVAGPLPVAIRKTSSCAVTDSTPGSRSSRSCQPGGALAKLTSSEFLPGIDAFELQRRIERLQLAVIDDGDAIAQLVGLVHVVRRDQNGRGRARA